MAFPPKYNRFAKCCRTTILSDLMSGGYIVGTPDSSTVNHNGKILSLLVFRPLRTRGRNADEGPGHNEDRLRLLYDEATKMFNGVATHS